MTTCDPDIHVGDGPLLWYFTVQTKNAAGVCVAYDLSLAATLEVLFQKPDGTIVTRAAAAKTPPGADGIVAYTSPTTEFDVSGTWHVTARLSGASLNYQCTNSRFTVKDKWVSQ